MPEKEWNTARRHANLNISLFMQIHPPSPQKSDHSCWRRVPGLVTGGMYRAGIGSNPPSTVHNGRHITIPTQTHPASLPSGRTNVTPTINLARAHWAEKGIPDLYTRPYPFPPSPRPPLPLFLYFCNSLHMRLTHFCCST